MKKNLLLLLAFFLFAFNTHAQCGPGQDTTPPVFGDAGDGTMANPFRNLLQSTVGSVPSGTYYFNFNGSTFQGELDNDTDGGGWLMILNYVHVAGDNSALTVRNTDLPLLGSSTLGDNEAGTANWGHMGNALAAAIDFEEVRFYGATTGHSRIIDFKTNYQRVLDYLKTGVGSFAGIHNAPNFATLANHTATIPAQAFNVFTDQGDLALTNFPFWRSGQAHWGIGLANRWEVDDFAINTSSTIHRVWVRGDLSPAATTTLNLNLDTTGNVTVAPGDFGLAVTDNCAAAPNLSLSQTDFDCTNIGNNVVQLTATDDQNNSTSIDVTVTIIDSAPVITTDNFIDVDVDATGNVSITLADLNASATDDCGLQSFTIDRTDFDCSNVGPSNVVTLTATDNNGAVSTSQVIVFVNDPIDPVVQCVAPFTLELDNTGNARITEDDVVLSATDNCDIRSISLSRSLFTCLDIGDNTVTVTVRDNDGNRVTCTTTVTVTIPSCPSDFTLESDPTSCGAIYNYPCASNITAGPPSGSLLAAGSTTTFTYDTLDNTGATVSCSFDVTVVDTRAPIFDTKEHTVTLNPSETATILSTDIIGANPLAFDYTVETSGTFDRVDISTTGTLVTLEDDEVSTALPIGFEFAFYGYLYTEFYISSNGFITFSDNQEDGCCNGQNLPDTDEPNNLIAFDWNDIDPEDGGTMRYTTIGTAPNRILIMDWDSVTHIDDSDDITTTQVKLFEGTNRIEIHTTNIPLTGDDKTQGLENIDGTAAIIVPGRNATQWGATNDYVAFVPTSEVFDNCSIDTVEVSPNTFDCSNKGDNVVTLTVTDVNGNVASKTANVRVETVDTTAPIITLNGSDPQIIEFGDGYAELGATTDDGSAVVINTDNFVDALGTYTIRYNATDDSCNDAEVTRTIEVIDTTAPIITLLGDNPQMIGPGETYVELGATTNDGTEVTIDLSQFINAEGTYTITYNSVDPFGNVATPVTRTVIVAGCAIDTLPENNFQVAASSETCPGKNNGIIAVTTIISGDYIATIDGQQYPFTSTLEVADLAPGNYPVCFIVNGEPNCEVCFQLAIEEGIVMSGETSVTNANSFNKQVQVNIEKGTPPFTVMINNEIIGEYPTHNFVINAKSGDAIEVSSSLECEGKLTSKIDGSLFENVTLSPNPTRDQVTITWPEIGKNSISVSVRNALGMTVSSQQYSVVGGRVVLPMQELPTGIYFIQIDNEVAKTFKVIKN